MDDFKENGQPSEAETEAEQSTVFSAPAEHTDNDLKSPKKRRITAVIAAVLAVCVLVGGTLAVIKFIPKLEDSENTDSEEDKTISVINFDANGFDAVTVKNSNGEFGFYPQKAESDDDSSDEDSSEPQIKWYLKGVSKKKISTDKNAEVVSAAAKISATMEITKKTFEECGLGDPVAVVKVASKKFGDFSLTVGDTSPDNTGVYLYSSIDKKIYLVAESVSDSFIFTDLDLAGTEAIAPLAVKDMDEKYLDGNGNLAFFDKLEISGGKYEHKIVIAPVEEKEGEAVAFAYKVISPAERFAETEPVSQIFSAFSTGITVTGAYSLDNDAETLAKFGLDKPDAALTLTLGSKTYTYKFTLQKDGFYAMSGDGVDTVKKISVSDASFLDKKETDIYNKLAYIRSISEISKMTFELKDKSYSFSIKENADDDEEKFTVYYGKKLIKSENFQNFYMHFVSLALADFSYKEGGETAMTVSVTDNGGKTEKLVFNKASATEYYCSLSGEPLGKITASSYNKLISDLDTVSHNKDVENN